MFAFYAGLFLGVGEVSNMVGVASCVPIASKLGKKTTFIMVNASLVVLSIAFYFIPCTPTGYWTMLVFQVLISILTGIMSPLVWSMYADVSDYAELEFHTASTGLIFSSSSMAQKFGGAIGGAAVLWLLDGFGYITDAQQLAAGVVQPEGALSCLRWLMSFIPALVALVSMCIVWFYPLTTERITQINKELKELRSYYRDVDEND
jgi:GPH family glycoside/pentoside/hexuronide:cation symporter